MKFSFAMLLMAVLAVSGNAIAQEQPIPWSSLSEAQQELLNPHAADWDSLGADRQAQLAAGAQRFS